MHTGIDVSLSVADEDFVVLVGPSGCGKTSLLRLVAGLDDLSSGAITIGSVDVSLPYGSPSPHNDATRLCML